LDNLGAFLSNEALSRSLKKYCADDIQTTRNFQTMHHSQSESTPSFQLKQSANFTFLDWIKAAKRQLTVFGLMFLFAFVPIAFPSKEMLSAYVVLLMGTLWMSEVIPLAVTALLPVILFPAFGILNAHDVSVIYLADSNFIFVGSLIMAVAIETSNLHERIALRILIFTGSNPRWLMGGFQLSTALLSMWISNTATTAMMVPIAMAVIRELRMFEESKAVNAENTALQLDAMDQAENPLDIRRIPPREMNIYKVRGSFYALLLSICYSASIGGIGSLIGTGPNIVLAGDLEKLYLGKTPITFASWLAFAVPQLVISLLFCWIWLQTIFIGFRYYEMQSKYLSSSIDFYHSQKIFSRTQEDDESRVERMLKHKYARLGPLKFDERIVLALFATLVFLWLFREPKIIPGWISLFKERFISDGTVAMSIAFLLFVVPAENPLKPPSDDKEFRTLMSWEQMKEKFSWSTVLLLGGGYALAEGVEESGLSDMLGSQLASLTTLPRWMFISVSCVFITIITEFSSNVATASIFIPMVNSIAKSTRTNPLLYILPTVLSCSYSFMLPAGSPANAIVFSSKMIRVVDMVKAGFTLNAFSVLMTITFTHTYTWWLFDLGDFPQWAEYNRTTLHPHGP
uniref:Solute carrier family 13 member 2 n=1 Tax=Anisakis simplex TaxID=6269 RepID=A0A0M3JZM0_ANISI